MLPFRPTNWPCTAAIGDLAYEFMKKHIDGTLHPELACREWLIAVSGEREHLGLEFRLGTRPILMRMSIVTSLQCPAGIGSGPEGPRSVNAAPQN